MSHLRIFAITSLLVSALLTGCGGAAGPSKVPAPCAANSDCPAGAACLHIRGTSGQAGPGYCDVEEHNASAASATPAPCSRDEDCGSSLCVQRRDDAGQNIGWFCHVEGQACPHLCRTGDRTQICSSDADCGAGTCEASSMCAF